MLSRPARAERLLSRRMLCTLLAGFAIWIVAGSGVAAPPSESEFAEQETAAMAAVNAYIEAFNSRDAERFAKTLFYPHMRVDGLGRPKTWDRWEDYAAQVDFDAISRSEGWHHTQIDWIKPIQSGTDKVHVAIGFTRYNAGNEPILSQQSLYVVTCRDGKWAIQVRSSFLEQK